MDWEYILLISAGGVFAFLLFFYLLVAIERSKSRKRNAQVIIDSYKEENLRTMEYDIAFYDEEEHRRANGADSDRQVTIEDLLKSGQKDKTPNARLFSQIEEGGIEEIVGKYNPEKVKK